MLPEYLECLTTATGRQALEGASHKMLHNPGSCTFPRLSEPRRVLAARLPISSMLNSCTSLPSRRTDFPKATWIFPLTWTRVFNFTYVAWCTQPLSLWLLTCLVHNNFASYSAPNGALALHCCVQHVEVRQPLRIKQTVKLLEERVYAV